MFKGNKPLVVHIITGLGIGGAERMLCRICAETADDYTHLVIPIFDILDLQDEFVSRGIDVVPLHVPYPASPATIPALFRGLGQVVAILKRHRRALVQGWMYHGNLFASAVAKLSRNSALWNVRHSVHDLSHESRSTAFLIRAGAVLSGSPRAIVYNSGVGAAQHERIGYSPANRVVIPNGFDTQVFSPDPLAREQLRFSLGLQDSALLVGVTGRFDPAKDHATFLAAAAIIQASVGDDVHFILTGRGLSPGNQTLQAIVQQHRLRNVHFLGERRDVEHVLAALDIAVSSSITEGFPNTIGEAMSCGVPCVVTDVGDSKFLIGDRGLVVPPSDPDSLARAVLDLLALSRHHLRLRGLEARARVVEKFGIGSVADAYKRLYQEVSAT